MNETMFYFEYEANQRVTEALYENRRQRVPFFGGLAENANGNRPASMWQRLTSQFRPAAESPRSGFRGVNRPQAQCC